MNGDGYPWNGIWFAIPRMEGLVMSVETRLLEAFRALSPEKQIEVLDFAEFLKRRKPEVQTDRPSGLCKGQFTVPDDFDDPLDPSEFPIP
jgi:hypothetical protein